MMAKRVTITIPDDLAARLEPYRDRLNLSQIATSALREAVNEAWIADMEKALVHMLYATPGLFDALGKLQIRLAGRVDREARFEHGQACYLICDAIRTELGRDVDVDDLEGAYLQLRLFAMAGSQYGNGEPIDVDFLWTNNDLFPGGLRNCELLKELLARKPTSRQMTNVTQVEGADA